MFQNKYPLDTLLDYRASVNDQLTPDQRRELDEIEEMLSCAMIKKGITPKITSFQKLQTDSKFMFSVDIDEVGRVHNGMCSISVGVHLQQSTQLPSYLVKLMCFQMTL